MYYLRRRQFYSGLGTFAAMLLGLSMNVHAQSPTRYAVNLMQSVPGLPSPLTVSPGTQGSGPKINNLGWVNLNGHVFVTSGAAPNIIGGLLNVTDNANNLISSSYDINNSNATTANIISPTAPPPTYSAYNYCTAYYHNAPPPNTTGFLGCIYGVGYQTQGMGGLTIGINDSNHAVGTVVYSTLSPYCSYLGGSTIMPTPSFACYFDCNLGQFGLYGNLPLPPNIRPAGSQANDIDAGDRAVGYSYALVGNGSQKHACIWKTKPPVFPNYPALPSSFPIPYDFGTLLSGNESEVLATNGQYFVGYSNYIFNGQPRATYFDTPSTNQDLGTLGGTTSCANDINRGTNITSIVGYATTASGEFHAFITTLPNNPQPPFNNTVIKSGVSLTDINSLVPGGNFANATGINDNGQIVVLGFYTPPGGTTQQGWFLLSPY